MRPVGVVRGDPEAMHKWGVADALWHGRFSLLRVRGRKRFSGVRVHWCTSTNCQVSG